MHIVIDRPTYVACILMRRLTQNRLLGSFAALQTDSAVGQWIDWSVNRWIIASKSRQEEMVIPCCIVAIIVIITTTAIVIVIVVVVAACKRRVVIFLPGKWSERSVDVRKMSEDCFGRWPTEAAAAITHIKHHPVSMWTPEVTDALCYLTACINQMDSSSASFLNHHLSSFYHFCFFFFFIFIFFLFYFFSVILFFCFLFVFTSNFFFFRLLHRPLFLSSLFFF